MTKQNKFSKINKSASILQIFVLFVGIIAIGWAVGGEVRIVSGVEDRCNKDSIECDPTYKCVDDFTAEGLIKKGVDCTTGEGCSIWSRTPKCCKTGSGQECNTCAGCFPTDTNRDGTLDKCTKTEYSYIIKPGTYKCDKSCCWPQDKGEDSCEKIKSEVISMQTEVKNKIDADGGLTTSYKEDLLTRLTPMSKRYKDLKCNFN